MLMLTGARRLVDSTYQTWLSVGHNHCVPWAQPHTSAFKLRANQTGAKLHCLCSYRMLVIAQVVLAMQLPFTLIPLIKSTSSRAIMGVFASSWLRSMVAWAASFIVFTANLLMLVDMLWMESPEQIAARQEEQGFADKGFDEWLAQVMDVMTRCELPYHGATRLCL